LGIVSGVTRSISLGRIAGVEIGLNWSWLIVFGLIFMSLTAAVFPAQNPGLSDSSYLAMGFVAALLFFGSILLHELGHALQARREGIEIEGITLWLFGGVARFNGMFESPGAEFRIAIAGPAVTLVLAAVLIGLGSLAELPSAVEGVVFWLGYINVVLLAFNLLPAQPLDGGRVLHSALWALRGQMLWATRLAAGIGIGFGYLLIGAGIVLLFAAPTLTGIWLVILGWFLATAAQAEAEQVVAREALGGIRVEDLMSGDPVTVAPAMTLGAFIDEVARQTRYTSYPVVEGKRPVGLLRFQDVTARSRAVWDEETVLDCMVPFERIVTLGPHDTASDALLAVGPEAPHRALVLDERGSLLGVLSIRDLMRAIQIETVADSGRAPSR
jgi:Zn-dependent protease/CBS domain-containing protein